MENAEEIEEIAELEVLISIDMHLEKLTEILTLLQWMFVSSFAVIGLLLIMIFFVGKGDKG